MKPGASLMERFEGWFVRPIEKLQEIPEGDGGFLALACALFLCERYYRALTKTHYGRGEDKPFKVAAAEDFGLTLEEFQCFWMVYRNGVQHQGIPRRYIDSNKVEYVWHIADEFGAIPEFYKINANKIEIRLNVWKFADLIISKLKSNPSVFRVAMTHSFAEVRENNQGK
ncbi:MAG TPA: hypothetical protein P5040_06900 [Smithella sp.]|nr:hypothetical protein [Smithella sp.]